VTTSILWFRRDLRFADHPALLAACDAADHVVPVFVLDDALRRPSGPNRLAFLYRNLRDLQDRTGGALRVLRGRPENAIPQLAKDIGAESVHISSDHGPYGQARDNRVRTALREVPLVATGSPYGVTPGALTKADGTPYRVFTPYARAWRDRGLHSPARRPRHLPWSDGGEASHEVPKDPDTRVELPEAGEEAALARWQVFREHALSAYHERRDLPGEDGTSRLSPYLKYGVLHPRTLHAELGRSQGEHAFATELIWRDFYADVLQHNPASARADLSPLGLDYEEPGTAFTAWQQGRTGYPIVDAGMRQLAAEGWMHNRLRMIVASFLTKDLHVWWWHGARHFLHHLVDGDLASNQHGWQWTAGTGTDASPYFRVFNPVTQGRRFDPDGAYIRHWVPELADLDGRAIHEPWTCERLPKGYPERIVDHAAERREALDRYQKARSS
jgi:deoxyribodipyrimidine photo-lyase